MTRRAENVRHEVLSDATAVVDPAAAAQPATRPSEIREAVPGA
jgi:hypothetical protein